MASKHGGGRGFERYVKGTMNNYKQLSVGDFWVVATTGLTHVHSIFHRHTTPLCYKHHVYRIVHFARVTGLIEYS